ncbi:hypothetical protein [Roseovarius aestuariivivens]|uniref:hypothetical protein n=1 Tax=Roseovarius aestuariivivens TaxID=1888910 RepID=UPI0010804355|nr:hypothetical protein [Roseovarius aestuariivivens]
MTRLSSRGIVLLALTAACPASPALTAEPVPCDRPGIFVTTDDPELHDRTCAVASAALPRFEACHLKQYHPVNFHFNDAILPSNRICLGLYHAGTNQVELLTPEAFGEAHLQSEFCEGLSEDAHFDSIIVHELTHALLDQVPGGTSRYFVDQEYIAYAMQLDLLPEAERATMLSGTELAKAPGLERFNELVLMFSPYTFAVSAWQHFSEPGNGCDFVGQIVRKEQTFWLDPS